MRYVLLDKITSLDPPHRATGVKCVSLADDCFVDHFPGQPVMPGALLVEGLAQLAGVLVEQTLAIEHRHAVLTMIDRCRFRRVVVPGDQVRMFAEVVRVREDGGRAKVHAEVEGERAVDAELTFVFAAVTNERLLRRRREYLNIWLHGTSEPGGADLP